MRDNRRTRTVLGLLLLVSLTLVVLSLRGGGDGARDSAGGFFGPVENAASAIVRPVRDFLGVDRQPRAPRTSRSTTSRRRTTSSSSQLNTTEYDRNRAQELDDLLRLAGAGPVPRSCPRRSSRSAPTQGFAWTVTHRRRAAATASRSTRTSSTARASWAASSGSGPRTSVVVLLVDATSTVGARIESSMEVGFLNGTGDPRSLELQLLDPFAPVQAGERLVSFGVEGGGRTCRASRSARSPRCAGTPGQLTRVATVVPFVDVTALDLVGVIVEPPRTDPRDAVLPPKPDHRAEPGRRASAPRRPRRPRPSPSPGLLRHGRPGSAWLLAGALVVTACSLQLTVLPLLRPARGDPRPRRRDRRSPSASSGGPVRGAVAGFAPGCCSTCVPPGRRRARAQRGRARGGRLPRRPARRRARPVAAGHRRRSPALLAGGAVLGLAMVGGIVIDPRVAVGPGAAAAAHAGGVRRDPGALRRARRGCAVAPGRPASAAVRVAGRELTVARTGPTRG